MKFTALFFLCVTIGLLTASHAQLGTGNGYLPFMPDIGFFGLKDQQAGVIKMLEAECDGTLKKEGAYLVQKAINGTGECFLHLITSHQEELSSVLGLDATFDDIHRTVCGLSPEFLKCMKGATEVLRDCMTFDDATKETADKSMEMTVKYVCSWKGKIRLNDAIEELMESPTNIYCLQLRLQDAMHLCYDISDIESGKYRFFALNDAEACWDAVKRVSCVTAELKKCDLPMIYTFVKEIAQRSYEASRCSSGSCHSVLPFILFLMLLAIIINHIIRDIYLL